MAAPALRQPEPDLPDEFAHAIWDRKYRERDKPRPLDTFRRVARAVAEAEPLVQREQVAARFFDELSSLRFLPGGRILAGAGTGRDVTLLNCFVLGVIEDNMEGIFRALADAALTMQ